MNIALFASAFYPHVGGVEELVRQLAREYNARGDKAIVLTNRWPRDLPAHEEYEGIPVYRLAMRAPGSAASWPCATRPPARPWRSPAGPSSSNVSAIR